MYPDNMSTLKSIDSLVKRYIKYHSKDDFAAIYRQTVDDLYRFILSKTNDASVAEEVVSDTYFALIDLVHKFDSKRSKFKTFLFGIGLNKLRQRWDQQKANRSFSLDEEIHIESEYKPRTNSAKLMVQIMNALKKLTDKSRKVVSLRFMESLSINEVAEKLGISKTNVTTIQNRAIDKLRQIINEKK
jgi:RNA polymerase sigma-70 factor (ECF subfamily)